MGLAARGLRDLDDGVRSIDDASELAQVRRQARKVHIQALVVAAAVAAALALAPA